MSIGTLNLSGDALASVLRLVNKNARTLGSWNARQLGPPSVLWNKQTFSYSSRISLACLREVTPLASTFSMPSMCRTVSAETLARTGAMSDTIRSLRRSPGVSGLRARLAATFPPLKKGWGDKRHHSTAGYNDRVHGMSKEGNIGEGKFLAETENIGRHVYVSHGPDVGRGTVVAQVLSLH